MIRPNAVLNYCIELAKRYDKQLTPEQSALALKVAKSCTDEQANQGIRECLFKAWGLTTATALKLVHDKQTRDIQHRRRKQLLKQLADLFDQKVLEELIKVEERDQIMETLTKRRHLEV